MTKLEKGLRRLHKEGVLGNFLNRIKQNIQKLNDKQFEKELKRHDKEHQRLLKKIRDLEKTSPYK